MVMLNVLKPLKRTVARNLASKLLARSVDFDVNVSQSRYAVDWLRWFGYLESDDDPKEGVAVRGTRKFQKLYGIKEDGIVGPRSLSAMQLKRCGCPDFHFTGLSAKGRKLEGPGVSRWGKRLITYRFDSYLDRISRADQDRMFEEACDLWSEVADVKLIPADDDDPVDILVHAARGRGAQLDGPGGTIGYTYLRSQWDPEQRGPIPLVLDLDENWGADPNTALVYYLAVVAHELGHCLDLDHSQVQDSLMAPIYRSSVWRPVEPDDHSRIIKQFGPVKIDPPGDSEGPTPPRRFTGRIVKEYSDGRLIRTEVQE